MSAPAQNTSSALPWSLWGKIAVYAQTYRAASWSVDIGQSRRKIEREINYMKIAPFFLVLALLACAGCFKFTSVAGSSHVVTTNFNFTGFQSIEAGGAFTVKIQPGDQFAVSVSADDNLLNDLSIIQDGSWLRLGVKNGINISSPTLAATVTLPNLADRQARFA